MWTACVGFRQQNPVSLNLPVNCAVNGGNCDQRCEAGSSEAGTLDHCACDAGYTLDSSGHKCLGGCQTLTLTWICCIVNLWNIHWVLTRSECSNYFKAFYDSCDGLSYDRTTTHVIGSWSAPVLKVGDKIIMITEKCYFCFFPWLKWEIFAAMLQHSGVYQMLVFDFWFTHSSPKFGPKLEV